MAPPRPPRRAHRRSRLASLGFAGGAFLVGIAALLAVSASAEVPPRMTSATNSGKPPISATANPSASTNLLSGRQSTFGGTTGGWSGGNASLSWTARPATGSTGSLVVTATTNQPESAWSGPASSSDLTPATPGRLYTGKASVLSGPPSVTVVDVIGFYSATGQVLTSVWGTGVSITSSDWRTLPTVAAIAPPSTASTVLGVIAYTSLPGERVFIDSPYLADPPSAGSQPVAGPLHTSGNQILDAKGKRVDLHGVVLDGLESKPSPDVITEQSVLQAKVWGANIIRLPLGEQFWLSSSCDYVSSYQNTVGQVVNWITSLGMVALLDLHSNTVGTVGPFGLCQPGGPHNMADEAQSPIFWSQVAARYGDNPLVAFDLYNEPHNISDSVWLNGGTTIDTESLAVYQTAGMQQLYDAVRSTGAQNLVFISGNNWANTVPATLVRGDNIVYAVHAYTCPDAAPPACGSSSPYDPSSILDNWIGPSASIPVMVTEFGWPSLYDGTYNANVISFARAQGWGWIAYSWGAGDDGPFSLVSQSPPTGPYEPTPSGGPVLLALWGGGR